MKSIQIANYSIYCDGFYTPEEINFRKLYKGVRVSVNEGDCGGDSRFIHFSIRTTKVRTCIWKRQSEEMKALVFDDQSNSVTCDFDKDPKNVSLHTLTFKEEVYLELKQNIPTYLEHCGVRFKKVEKRSNLMLLFGKFRAFK